MLGIRTPALTLGLLPGREAVADPGFGAEVTRYRKVGLDLFSQAIDEYAKILSLVRVLTSPERSQQSAMSQNLAPVVGKVNKQFELFWR